MIEDVSIFENASIFEFDNYYSFGNYIYNIIQPNITGDLNMFKYILGK